MGKTKPQNKEDFPHSNSIEKTIVENADAQTIYSPEKPKDGLSLTEDQKEMIRHITLGIEEIDETVRSMAVEDVLLTLENGHPLNRIIIGKEGEIVGYIACEDLVPHEAYIKYLGTTGQTGRNLLKEIPAFLDYAIQQGYTKLNFHGWNDRLNHVLERYGFKRMRTDAMADFRVDFYEKVLIEEKSPEYINDERRRAFEEKYLNKLQQEYQKTLATFSQKDRPDKERLIEDFFQKISNRCGEMMFELGTIQQAVLKLKLARHFQRTDTCDVNTLSDAIIESPKFISTDKGSLDRLLEVHEEKVTQKIAEARKRRAEMEDTGALNPYEALFTTSSGNYYMARLLNMPHLEDESEYMKHCVGTSDSYVNQIKRGEIEILSFRHVPKINPTTQKLEGDIPIITIEYNLKTKTIEQMKKYNDEYLSPDDPYFSDVIDALKKLRTTTTDTGALRNFNKISPSELENIKVKDYYILTEQGEIFFKDFDPDVGILVLKIGDMEIGPTDSKKDIAKIIQIVKGIKFRPEDIAQRPEEVTEATKIFIGPLTPNMLDTLDHVEYVYTSFPERRITRKTVELGKYRSVEEYQKAFALAEAKTTNRSNDMLKKITIAGELVNLDLVVCSVADLGFPDGATREEIYKRAKEYGLELCPAEVGPALRLVYEDQPMDEWLLIGMEPIDADGYPHVFNLVRHADGARLHDHGGGADSFWYGADRWVFARRKSAL